jgi:hypothetical protein
MIFIIDGHGDEHNDTFDFKRKEGARVTLYSYTAAGISNPGTTALSLVNCALTGNIPMGYSEVKKSKIGGSLMKDRVLYPLASATDQPITTFPAGYVDRSDQNFRVLKNNALSVLYFALALDTQASIRLSEILAAFPDREFDMIWTPCRGAGGASPARYKKTLAMDPAKYTALFDKTYGQPNQP